MSKKLEDLLSNEVDPSFKRRANIILSELLKHKSSRILDIGCGRGFYEHAVLQILPKPIISGIDINDLYLKQARKNVKSQRAFFKKSSAYRLPFADNTFDAIIASEILEHLENDKLALREMFRVLRKNGILLVTVPHNNYPFLWDPVNYFLEKLFNIHVPSGVWWLAGIWADHVRLYSEDEILNKIKQAKFGLESLMRLTHFCLPFTHFILYGIGKNIVERGWWSSMNRFSFSKKKSFLNSAIFRVIHLFDKKNDEIIFSKKDSFVNLLLVCKK
jgi:ubiquinone/menaquinone biosynthesis C-methylase UbiE